MRCEVRNPKASNTICAWSLQRGKGGRKGGDRGCRVQRLHARREIRTCSVLGRFTTGQGTLATHRLVRT